MIFMMPDDSDNDDGGNKMRCGGTGLRIKKIDNEDNRKRYDR